MTSYEGNMSMTSSPLEKSYDTIAESHPDVQGWDDSHWMRGVGKDESRDYIVYDKHNSKIPKFLAKILVCLPFLNYSSEYESISLTKAKKDLLENIQKLPRQPPKIQKENQEKISKALEKYLFTVDKLGKELGKKEGDTFREAYIQKPLEELEAFLTKRIELTQDVDSAAKNALESLQSKIKLYKEAPVDKKEKRTYKEGDIQQPCNKLLSEVFKTKIPKKLSDITHLTKGPPKPEFKAAISKIIQQQTKAIPKEKPKDVLKESVQAPIEKTEEKIPTEQAHEKPEDFSRFKGPPKPQFQQAIDAFFKKPPHKVKEQKTEEIAKQQVPDIVEEPKKLPFEEPGIAPPPPIPANFDVLPKPDDLPDDFSKHLPPPLPSLIPKTFSESKLHSEPSAQQKPYEIPPDLSDSIDFTQEIIENLAQVAMQEDKSSSEQKTQPIVEPLAVLEQNMSAVGEAPQPPAAPPFDEGAQQSSPPDLLVGKESNEKQVVQDKPPAPAQVESKPGAPKPPDDKSLIEGAKRLTKPGTLKITPEAQKIIDEHNTQVDEILQELAPGRDLAQLSFILKKLKDDPGLLIGSSKGLPESLIIPSGLGTKVYLSDMSLFVQKIYEKNIPVLTNKSFSSPQAAKKTEEELNTTLIQLKACVNKLLAQEKIKTILEEFEDASNVKNSAEFKELTKIAESNNHPLLQLPFVRHEFEQLKSTKIDPSSIKALHKLVQDYTKIEAGLKESKESLDKMKKDTDMQAVMKALNIKGTLPESLALQEIKSTSELKAYFGKIESQMSEVQILKETKFKTISDLKLKFSELKENVQNLNKEPYSAFFSGVLPYSQHLFHEIENRTLFHDPFQHASLKELPFTDEKSFNEWEKSLTKLTDEYSKGIKALTELKETLEKSGISEQLQKNLEEKMEPKQAFMKALTGDEKKWDWKTISEKFTSQTKGHLFRGGIEKAFDELLFDMKYMQNPKKVAGTNQGFFKPIFETQENIEKQDLLPKYAFDKYVQALSLLSNGMKTGVEKYTNLQKRLTEVSEKQESLKNTEAKALLDPFLIKAAEAHRKNILSANTEIAKGFQSQNPPAEIQRLQEFEKHFTGFIDKLKTIPATNRSDAKKLLAKSILATPPRLYSDIEKRKDEINQEQKKLQEALTDLEKEKVEAPKNIAQLLQGTIAQKEDTTQAIPTDEPSAFEDEI